MKTIKNAFVYTVITKDLRKTSLLHSEGNKMTKEEEKCEVLNGFFASVLSSNTSCSLGTHPLEPEHRDGELSETSIIPK